MRGSSQNTLWVLCVSLTCFLVLNIAHVSAQDGPIGNHYANRIYSIPAGSEEVVGVNQPDVFDINGDGRDDVVFFKFEPGPDHHVDDPTQLQIWTSNIDGLLENSTNEIIDGTVQVLRGAVFLVADFNSDGQLDIFIDASGAETNADPVQFPGEQNRLLLSSNDAKLHDVTPTHLPQRLDISWGSCAADFDGDGDIDIWVTNYGQYDGASEVPFPYLMFNDGEGRFSVVADFGVNLPGAVGPQGRLPEDLTYQSTWCSALDAEGDGDVDIVLGYSYTIEVCEGYFFCPLGEPRNEILINDGTGHFSIGERAWSGYEPPAYPEGTWQPWTHHGLVDDVNADGLDDALRYLTVGQDWETTILQILISNGDGTFRDESVERYGPENLPDMSDFQLHDLDGDGHKDLFSDVNFGTVDIRINDGEGYFRRLADDWVVVPSYEWLVLDVDGDGGTDFLINPKNGSRLSKMNLPYGAELDGTEEDDRLIGGALNNVYRGLEGDDVLDGGLGDDDLDGGPGDDELIGGKGDERMVSGSGTDSVNGGPGRDRIEYAFSIDEAEILLGATTHINRGNTSNDEIRDTEYALFTDAATPLPTAEQSAIGSLNGVAGLWYDPALDGEGFNVITTPSGTVIFFYGYTAQGQRLWLISETVSAGIAFNQVLDLRMYEAQGGTFDQPAPSSEAVSDWGHLKGLFDACGTGRFALHGADGVKVTYQIKLAGITNADCATGTLSAPSGLAGLWYDQTLDGEGYNVIITQSSTVFFFYGYDANGQRLWLISEALTGAPAVGVNTQLKMFSASGGTFDTPAPPAEALTDWGNLDFTFSSCGEAVANLTGTDGKKTSNLTKLAGISDSTCP